MYPLALYQMTFTNTLKVGERKKDRDRYRERVRKREIDRENNS